MHKQGFNTKLEVFRIPFLPRLNVNKPRVSLVRNDERVCLCPEKGMFIPPVSGRLELVRNDKLFLYEELTRYASYCVNKARYIGGIKFVILYRLGEDFKNEYRVFHVHHHAVMSEERMRQALYPNPQGNYFCFVFDEEVNINPDVNLARILTEYRLDTDNEYQEGAPIVVTGEKLMEYQI